MSNEIGSKNTYISKKDTQSASKLENILLEFSDLLKKLKKLDNLIAEYVNRKDDKTMQNSYLDQENNSIIGKHIQNIDNLSLSTLEEIFDSYEKITSPFILLNRWLDLYTNDAYKANVDFSSDRSGTFNIETEEMLQKIKIDASGIFKKFDLLDDELVNNMANSIEKLSPNTINVELLESLFVKYVNLNLNLYIEVVQRYIKIFYKENKPMMFKLLEIVEINKNYILNQNVDNASNASKPSKGNNPIQRYGFIPSTSMMNLEPLLSMIYKKSIKLPKGNLQSQLKHFEEVFIVSYYKSDTRMQYDTMKLLDIVLNTNIGVNEKMISDLNVIYELNETKSKNKMQFSYEIINKPSNDQYEKMRYIYLETFDGIQFRCLTPWKNAANAANFIVTYNKIKYLLNSINKMGLLPTNRAESYNKACIEKATSNMFVFKKLDFDEIESSTNKTIDLHTIRNTLYLKLTKHTNYLIDRKKPKMMQDVGEIVHDTELMNLFINIMFDVYKTQYSDLKFEHDEQSSSEILTTYLCELDDISRKFMKNLHDQFSRNNIIEDFSNDNIKKVIADYIDKAIIYAIGNENIFSVVILKNLLLTLS